MISLEAPAKVNLALEVLGRLEGGYHELDTVFCSLELGDRVHWQSAPRLELQVEGDPGLSAGEDNLVVRAVRSLEAEVGRPLPGRIVLEKRVPAGGGLGGGSADAGALLYGLNQHLQLGLSQERLLGMASRLGADVAFSLMGGTARGRHRGEHLESVPAAPGLPVILVFPPFGCPTGQVYGLWDEARYRPAAGCSQRMVEALASGRPERVVEALGNDLEPAALALRPQLVALRQHLQEAGCDGVLLAGSGSSLFGLVLEQERCDQVAGRLAQQLGESARVLVTRLRGRGRAA